jgi:hypothetical protein
MHIDIDKIHVVDAVVGSNWCTSFRDSNQARSKQSEDKSYTFDALNKVLNSLTLTEQ